MTNYNIWKHLNIPSFSLFILILFSNFTAEF